MKSIKHTLQSLQERRRRRRAQLPWAELEAEAARQGCSPADIFFDRAGRERGVPPIGSLPSARNLDSAADARGQQRTSVRQLAGIAARKSEARPRPR
jgi:hypothetical protein